MFQNREEAAALIARQLEGYRGKNALVLAIPRGGVPMGRMIADALEGELDVILVHKLGAPENPEYAVGAVDESGLIALTPDGVRMGLSEGYVQREADAQLAVMRERRRRYGRPSADPRDRIVIIVDDGIATGATLLAAIAAVRAHGPLELIAAVGVAPPDTAARIGAAVDRLVCLETPENFFAVGQFFTDFSQVSDDEVIAFLNPRKQE